MKRAVIFVMMTAVIFCSTQPVLAWTQLQVHFLGQYPKNGFGVPLLLRTNWVDSSDAYAESDPQSRHNFLFAGGGIGYQGENFWLRAIGGPGILAAGRQSVVALATVHLNIKDFMLEAEWEGIENSEEIPRLRHTSQLTAGHAFKGVVFIGAVGSYFQRSGKKLMYYQPSVNQLESNPDWYNNPVSQKGNEIWGVGGKLAFLGKPDSYGRNSWELFMRIEYLMAGPGGWPIDQPNDWRGVVELEERRQQRLANDPGADTSDIHPENGATMYTIGVKFNLGVGD